MPHHSHRIAAYRDDNQVWITFCEWCGADTEEKLEEECSKRYASMTDLTIIAAGPSHPLDLNGVRHSSRCAVWFASPFRAVRNKCDCNAKPVDKLNDKD